MAVTLDPGAIARGGAVAVVVCLPTALMADALGDEGDPSGWVFLLYFAVLVGFAAGGFVAGRGTREYPYTNGAAAALAAFVLIQGIGILVRVAGDEPVQYVGVLFNALLAYGAGLTGAVAGARNTQQT